MKNKDSKHKKEKILLYSNYIHIHITKIYSLNLLRGRTINHVYTPRVNIFLECHFSFGFSILLTCTRGTYVYNTIFSSHGKVFTKCISRDWTWLSYEEFSFAHVGCIVVHNYILSSSVNVGNIYTTQSKDVHNINQLIVT